jgi:hypothetical protein
MIPQHVKVLSKNAGVVASSCEVNFLVNLFSEAWNKQNKIALHTQRYNGSIPRD